MGDMRDYADDGYDAAGDVFSTMAEDQKKRATGYDDQFNDGVVRASVRTSSLRRPDLWPVSASEMGRRVAYQDAGMGADPDKALVRAVLVSSSRAKPNGWGKSSSEMRGYVDFQQGQLAGDTDSSHLRNAGRMSAPPPSRHGWTFSLDQGRWVRG